MVAELEFHSLTAPYPLLVGKAFDELVEDVREHGIRQKIVMHPDGTILDGRNRYRAWRRLGGRPEDIPRIIWSGPTDKDTLMALLYSLNNMRRHLTFDQCVGLAGQLLESVEEEAKARLLAGKATEDPSESVQQAADRLKVTQNAIKDIKRLSHSRPQIWQELVDQRITVNRARKILAPPEPKRKAPEEGVDLLERAHEETRPIAELEKQIRMGRSQVKKWAQEQWAAHLAPGLTTMDIEFGNLIESLRGGLPYGICGHCRGDGCELCKMLGWLPKHIWDNQPSELKR